MKSQVNIVSAIIIIILAIGLVATVYNWGFPLIQKRQDWSIVERVRSYFDQNNINSLPSKIEYIANNRGEDIFHSTVEGIWKLNENENFISFTFFSKVSDIAVDKGWVPLTIGASCPPSPGFLGIHKGSVVCARADYHKDGYNITYRIWFRTLLESGKDRGYKIKLVRHEASPISSVGKDVRITYSGISYETLNGKTITITNIKILLG